MDLYNEIYHHPDYDPNKFFSTNVNDKSKHKIKEICKSSIFFLCIAEIFIKYRKNDAKIFELLLNALEYPLARHYLSRMIMTNDKVTDDHFNIAYCILRQTG